MYKYRRTLLVAKKQTKLGAAVDAVFDNINMILAVATIIVVPFCKVVLGW